MLVYPNIEAERVRTGRTRLEVARHLGVSTRSLHNWQAGRCPIPSTKLCALCDLFQCSADYLLGRSEQRRVS